MSAPLLAVDAPSMLFRAFYALPDSIKAPSGEPVNALLGAANLILQEVERRQPRAVVLCFGPDAATYRVELYDGYHAERPEMPDGLVGQFADAEAFFGAFGWTIAAHDALEADDVLGTLARLEAEAGGEALLLTGDRDMFQCAGERVAVLYVSTGKKGAEEITPAERDELLRNAIATDEANPRSRRYAVRRSSAGLEVYDAKCHGDYEGEPEFHAHPAGYVPASVLRALRDSGVLTLPEYKKLVRQFGQ